MKRRVYRILQPIIASLFLFSSCSQLCAYAKQDFAAVRSFTNFVTIVGLFCQSDTINFPCCELQKVLTAALEDEDRCDIYATLIVKSCRAFFKPKEIDSYTQGFNYIYGNNIKMQDTIGCFFAGFVRDLGKGQIAKKIRKNKACKDNIVLKRSVRIGLMTVWSMLVGCVEACAYKANRLDSENIILNFFKLAGLELALNSFNEILAELLVQTADNYDLEELDSKIDDIDKDREEQEDRCRQTPEFIDLDPIL